MSACDRARGRPLFSDPGGSSLLTAWNCPVHTAGWCCSRGHGGAAQAALGAHGVDDTTLLLSASLDRGHGRSLIDQNKIKKQPLMKSGLAARRRRRRRRRRLASYAWRLTSYAMPPGF